MQYLVTMLCCLSDSAVLKFGADSDVTLTHAADTSLTCNLMMAATTFEPSADTAAGDNAAIGLHKRRRLNPDRARLIDRCNN
jgi:hypothetical protein